MIDWHLAAHLLCIQQSQTHMYVLLASNAVELHSY
jgi:hypothetical protein